jgi:O-antigen/teichoic acid export membrane protein
MRLARIINNSAALLLLDLLGKAMPLVVFPVMVRALGPTAYGKVGFATAVAGFFALAASPGFSVYALREAARDERRVNFLVQHVLGARVVFAVVSYALLIVFGLTLAPRDFTTRLLLVLSGLSFLFNSVDTQWIFTARSRMWMVTLRGTVGQLIYGGIILALIRRPSDAWIVPVASALSVLVGMLLIWLPARREFRIPFPAFAPRMWRGFLSVCLILGLSSMMSMLYDQIDTVMLRYMRSATELGLYVASYRMMTIAMSFISILGTVFFPLLSETTGRNDNDEQRYLGWYWHASIGLALPIAIGGFILAEPLTQFALGAAYAGAGTLFRWLTLTVVAGPLASYFGAQLIPSGRENKYLVAVVAGAVVNVVLNLLLIPRFGAIAAALTTALSQAVVAAINYYFVSDLPRPSMLKGLGLSAIASTLMATGLLAARAVLPLHVVAQVILGAILYATVYWAGRSLWNRAQTNF